MKNEPLRILFVEDDVVDQWAFTRLIRAEALPYRFEIAGSVAEARVLLSTAEYDVALTDHELGDGTAFDLLDLMLARGVLAIMITGLGDAAVAVKALQAGFTNYVVKDHDRNYLSALPQTIERALQRQRLERALKESESAYRSVVEDASDIIYRTDGAGRFTFYNLTVSRVLGYDMLELVGTRYLDLVRPDFRQAVRNFYARQVAQRLSNTYFELPALTKAGAVCWLGQNVQLLSDGSGITGFQAVARDISDRKAAEEIVAQSHQRLVRAEQIGKLGSWEWDLADNTVTWTNGLFHLFGLSPDEFEATASAFVERVYPPDREHVRGVLEAAIHDGQRFEFENRIVRPDGELRDLYTRGEIRLNEQGKPARIFGVALDISERKRFEEALRQSEARFASAFENAAIGIALVATDGRWLRVNRALCELTGYTADQLMAMSFQDITHPADLYADLEYVRQMLARDIQTYQLENRYFHHDGSIVWVLLSVSLVRAGDGQPVHFIFQIQDISERKRAEQALLRRNTELAALNQMGQALSRLSEPAAVLELLFEVTGKVLDNRNLYIALYDETAQTISFPIYTIDAARAARVPRSLANGLTERIIRSRQPLFFPRDVENAARAVGVEPQGRASQCYLGVPMLAGDKLLGVIAVQDYERAEVYDQAHLALLVTIAAQASIALENARLFAETQSMARTDALTGAANRHYLFELGAQELSRARRFGHPLSALMLDIDNFKRVNDTYGHAVGDQVLQQVVRCCRSHLREIDIVGRYGGEEFVILLIETNSAGARISAERLCAQLACLPLATDAGVMQITISVGVASARVESDGFASLLVRADSALYAAKQAGRNRVEVA